jgi:hypothetical protein
MQFHVVDPRKVYTKAGFVAATGGLSLTTLLTASDATKKLTVTQQTTSKGKLRIKVAGAGRDEDVLSFDLTFGGIYAGATTGFIVHAIEESLLRPNCTGCGGGGNGSGNSSSSSGIEDKPDGEYDKPSGKPVTAADVADCKRLLEAASISYEGSTVVGAAWVCRHGLLSGRPLDPNEGRLRPCSRLLCSASANSDNRDRRAASSSECSVSSALVHATANPRLPPAVAAPVRNYLRSAVLPHEQGHRAPGKGRRP